MMLDSDTQVIDIAEMNETEASDMLRSFIDNGFHGSFGEAALVLGRPETELQRMLDGIEPVDEDLIMKVRGTAQERGIDVGVEFADEDDNEE